MGKAVVSTSVGAEGLAVDHGVNILIGDQPEEFASAVVRVLTDETLRHRLEHQARRTAETLYDWDVIGGPMIKRYLSLIRAKSN